MREIVRAEAWKGFRELIEELGGDPSEILAAARVDERSLDHPERYLPLRWIVESTEIAANRLGRKDFGLLCGARNNATVLGTLWLAATNSSSGREGFETVGRYIHIHNPALTATITPIPRTTRDLVSIHFRSRAHQSANQYLERGVASIDGALRVLCGSTYRPTEVWFCNEQVSPLNVYRRMFGVTPRFKQRAMGIVIERALLDAIQPGNLQLRTLAESYLRSLGASRTDIFSHRVTALVRGLINDGDCSSMQAARALGIHERTLQRRLEAEQTSFEQIKDDVLKELAQSLLAQPNVSLSHIAYVLSYSDSSAFSRSARRWFGMSPRAYRVQLLAMPRTESPLVPRPRTRAWEAAVLARHERVSQTVKRTRQLRSKS